MLDFLFIQYVIMRVFHILANPLGHPQLWVLFDSSPNIITPFEGLISSLLYAIAIFRVARVQFRSKKWLETVITILGFNLFVPVFFYFFKYRKIMKDPGYRLPEPPRQVYFWAVFGLILSITIFIPVGLLPLPTPFIGFFISFLVLIKISLIEDIEGKILPIMGLIFPLFYFALFYYANITNPNPVIEMASNVILKTFVFLMGSPYIFN